MSAASTPAIVSRLPDADMQAVPAALMRAALRAREVAVRTGTPLVVVRDGKLIEEVVVPTQPAPSTEGASHGH